MFWVIFSWICIIGLILMFLGRVFLKIIEHVTRGHLKFFDLGFSEPIYSKEPRSVKFF